MLYKKKNEKELSDQLFQYPTSEYKGTPFWSWNTKLEKELLLEEIDQMKEMGMGGFHMHSRTGLDTKYLSDEFMDIVKTCHEKAKKEGMLTWLYDEDRWPSGFAGGMVTKKEENRIRYLIFTPFLKKERVPYTYETRVAATSHGGGELLAKYRIHLEQGYLTGYERLEPKQETSEDENIWYAYLEIGPDNPWYNNQAYVNTLDKNAILEFIQYTHEKYKSVLGEEFGKSIPAIFSDEPQMAYKTYLNFAEEKKDVMMPFSDKLPKEFQMEYHLDLLDGLPELFWELPDEKISRIRYLFHDFLGECFTKATFDTLGEWCQNNNILCTGHLMNESSLYLQTISMGDAMRCYRNFGLPGIDMLCDRREFNTAKQAQSIAHQYGKEGVLSEEYGVTNWDFDFRNHKLQGDWQAALGVTVRVHHLNHVSLAGEAKRDYPASIGYQSSWYKHYSYIENHFSRLNTALTRGKAVVRVGVIHPVESYWLYFGPSNQTSEKRKQMDENFEKLTDWLLTSLVDFDFISESLLPQQYHYEADDKLHVGEMMYDAVIVPNCVTLRRSTLEKLKVFQKDGGQLVFVGKPANYVDVSPSVEVKDLALNSHCVSMEKQAIISKLEAYRSIDIKVFENNGPNTIKHEPNPFAEKGNRTNNLIYQLREDEEAKWLFLCNAFPIENPDIPCSQTVLIEIPGYYQIDYYDTLTGTIQKNIMVKHKNETTVILWKLEYHDSALFYLKATNQLQQEQIIVKEEQEQCVKEIQFSEPVSITLSEPNVVLLDMAEYQFDDEDWQKREEVLRIDDEIRKKLNLPLRMADVAQPWTNEEKEESSHVLKLRYRIYSELEIKNCELALEEIDSTHIVLNGVEIKKEQTGYFIDKSIIKTTLGTVKKGENELLLTISYKSKTNVEACFLLGDFGVKVEGQKPVITEPVRKLGFGDWTMKGLPFYAGNVTYHLEAEGMEGIWEVKSAAYRAALLIVQFDQQQEEILAFAPYVMKKEMKEGKHRIDITAFGSRVNTLGSLHNTDVWGTYHGPDAWRSRNDRWTYDYVLKPAGLLWSPIIKIIQK